MPLCGAQVLALRLLGVSGNSSQGFAHRMNVCCIPQHRCSETEGSGSSSIQDAPASAS